MDVFPDIVGRIKLDDPINALDVETSGGHISAEEDSSLIVAELIEGVQSLLLLLLAVDVHNFDVNIVEKIIVEL